MESEKKTSGGDKYSKLAGNTIIFAISSFSSKLLTLLVQPFLTYAMAEIADLGLAKILSQYANLLIPFVSMGMSNAIIRFGLDKGNSEKQVFTNGLLTILGGFGILILCWPVAQFLPDMAQYGFLIYIYVLMSCLRTLCTQFVRSRQWNKLVAVDGILCTFATLMFYVLYLVGFHWGANGYLLAIISGDLVSVLFLCITGRLWNYVELKGLNRDLWQQMLRFSLPMIPAQISFWVINASDLFFVREMCGGLDGHSGDAWSGLLSTGYFLPTILTTLGLIFYDAWQLSAVTEEEGRARFFTKIFRTYSSVLFCCAAGIIWLCRPVMHVMKSNYYYAWHFVPFLTLASTCSCFNQFLNSAYVVNKKSTHSLLHQVVGAHRRNGGFLLRSGHRVRAARAGCPQHDRHVHPPGPGGGELRRAGRRGPAPAGRASALRPVDRPPDRRHHPVQLCRCLGHGPDAPAQAPGPPGQGSGERSGQLDQKVSKKRPSPGIAMQCGESRFLLISQLIRQRTPWQYRHSAWHPWRTSRHRSFLHIQGSAQRRPP